MSHLHTHMDPAFTTLTNVGCTMLTILLYYFSNMQELAGLAAILAGTSTLIYNGLRIYKDFIKKTPAHNGHDVNKESEPPSTKVV